MITKKDGGRSISSMTTNGLPVIRDIVEPRFREIACRGASIMCRGRKMGDLRLFTAGGKYLNVRLCENQDNICTQNNVRGRNLVVPSSSLGRKVHTDRPPRIGASTNAARSFRKSACAPWPTHRNCCPVATVDGQACLLLQRCRAPIRS